MQYASTTASSSKALVAETMTMEWDSRNHMGIEVGGDGEICGEGPGYAVE